jgi:hypothetical protein
VGAVLRAARGAQLLARGERSLLRGGRHGGGAHRRGGRRRVAAAAGWRGRGRRCRVGGGGGGGEEDAATAACLAALQTRGVSAAVVGKLDEEELAAVLAAFMVGYSGKRAHKFAALRRCLTAVFQGDDIAGDTLIGDSAVPEDAFSTAVVDGLNGDPACRATLGYRSRLATFLQLLRAPPPAPH